VAIAPVTDLEQLRQDAQNYTSARIVSRFIGSGEHVRLGSPAQNAEAFAAPVLMFHGTRDLNSPVAQSRMMNSALEAKGKPVTYVELDGRDHYIDDEQARSRMLLQIDQFLATSLGG
jgi:dipeptidyl aminopeptidase/acylaminoacyl peptidase